MLKSNLYNIILTPVVTEKSNLTVEGQNQAVFKVLKSATKIEVKAAFELVFGAMVEAVNILNVKGKAKRFGRFNGRRNNWKKAYITLKPGQNYELGESK